MVSDYEHIISSLNDCGLINMTYDEAMKDFKESLDFGVKHNMFSRNDVLKAFNYIKENCRG